MIALLALVALLAFTAGGLVGWIAASEYHGRFVCRHPPYKMTVRYGGSTARRDEWPGS